MEPHIKVLLDVLAWEATCKSATATLKEGFFEDGTAVGSEALADDARAQAVEIRKTMAQIDFGHNVSKKDGLPLSMVGMSGKEIYGLVRGWLRMGKKDAQLKKDLRGHVWG